MFKLGMSKKDTVPSTPKAAPPMAIPSARLLPRSSGHLWATMLIPGIEIYFAIDFAPWSR